MTDRQKSHATFARVTPLVRVPLPCPALVTTELVVSALPAGGQRAKFASNLAANCAPSLLVGRAQARQAGEIR